MSDGYGEFVGELPRQFDGGTSSVEFVGELPRQICLSKGNQNHAGRIPLMGRSALSTRYAAIIRPPQRSTSDTRPSGDRLVETMGNDSLATRRLLWMAQALSGCACASSSFQCSIDPVRRHYPFTTLLRLNYLADNAVKSIQRSSLKIQTALYATSQLAQNK
jgi:hypothetical protein